MKENLLVIGMIAGLFLILISTVVIIPITLINDYLIYGCVVLMGLITALIYIFFNKEKIIDVNEYLFIPIRCCLSLGPIIVFSFLWLNYYLKNQNNVTVQIPVQICFVDKKTVGSKFNRRTVIKSAFEIIYQGQTKNIVWHSRLEDSIINNVKAIEIKKSTGLFGIDIIEETNLIYK